MEVSYLGLAMAHLQRMKLAAAVAAVLVLPGCGCDYPCESVKDLFEWCIESQSCELDGQVVTECRCCGSTPDCRLWRLGSGTTLKIPLQGAWNSLGARDDLYVRFGLEDPSTKPDIRAATLLFNGAPASCSYDSQLDAMLCRNVPRTTHTLEFRYDDGSSPGDRTRRIYLWMHDLECEETHETCRG
jgi:hypothetical protein